MFRITGTVSTTGTAYENDFAIDDFAVEETPTEPIFNVSPDVKDYGEVNVGESSTQTFTISNQGPGTLQITTVALGITDQFDLTDLNTYPVDLTNGQSITVDVAFEPTSECAKAVTLSITDNQSKTVNDVPLSGTGFVPPQGSICSNPLPLAIPAVDIAGNTAGFFDDYNSTDINPSSYYLGGDDIVYQFTVTDGKMSGTIITTGSYIGAFVLETCPDAVNPPTPVILKTSSGTTLTFDDNIVAGTYFLIISSWPAPQSVDFIINLTHVESPATAVWTGAIDSDWDTDGNWNGSTVPGFTTNVTIPAGLGLGASYPTLTAAADCNDLTIESGATGDGSLIENGFLTVSGTVTAERYVSNVQWHGISAPVAGATAESLYSNTANVYLKSHDEATNAYTNIQALTDPLGDMQGFMMWYAGAATGETFGITGTLRSATVGSADNMVRTGLDADPVYYGWNYVGNPYSSAI
ncbi:MAG: hypothetical protein DRI92_06285, partial [Aquificota bacterium]